jgi:hypothetical protein
MASSLAGYGSVRHLAGRWLSSLWPGGPGVAGEAWARRWLNEGERALWERMSGPDRRHALGVARAAAEELGNADGAGVPTAALAAALMHDVGKIESGVGTTGRVIVTLTAIGVGRDRVAAWAEAPGRWRTKAGRYVVHDRLGGDLLEQAGSDPLVSSWARQHHLPVDRWTVDPYIADVLKRCDDD